MKGADITGAKFHRLTAIRPTGRYIGRSAVWECLCDCGNKIETAINALRHGSTKSCGCLRREKTSAQLTSQNTTHGRSGTPEHASWKAAIQRCTNPKDKRYSDYGGRGIKVCERWQKFENFLADMGERPPGTGLDRINNDGNYEPGNCRWATASEQCQNRRPKRRPA